MKVEYGNGWYFFYIILAALFVAGLYLILRNRTQKTQKTVLFLLSFANFLFHFLKYFGSIYYGTEKGMRELFFITICSSTIAFTPFAILSKSGAGKDYVFYLGIIGGLSALFIPTEAIAADSAFSFLAVRFYIQHTLLIAIPLVAVSLKLYKPNYKNIWKMPALAFFAFGFIMINHIIGYELGFLNVYDDFFHVRFFNPSLVWGPSDSLAEPLKILVPKFLKTVPAGEYAGHEKYWPLFWLTIPILLIMTVVPFIMCLLFDGKNVVAAIKTEYASITEKFRTAGRNIKARKNSKITDETNDSSSGETTQSENGEATDNRNEE